MSDDLISRKDIKDHISELMLVYKGVELNNAIFNAIDNAPTVEPKELKEIRNICKHWNDTSSNFVSACNAFEDILHIF